MIERREVFANVKSAVVALALGHPEEADNIGFTKTPASGMFEIVGTGFLVDDEGFVATAAHVVELMAQRIQVAKASNKRPPDPLIVVNERGFLDQRDGLWTVRYSTAYVRAMHTYRPADVGIVYVGRGNAPDALRSIEMSDEPCEEGDEVAACGYPHGLRLHNSGVASATFASGIVSGILPARDCPAMQRRLLQFDAMVLGGTSGGPLFDVGTGKVVGIVVSNYQATEHVPFGQSQKAIAIPHAISFAEDVYLLRRSLKHLKAKYAGQPVSESETGVIADDE
jgi:S1-C subfamily serine protease